MSSHFDKFKSLQRPFLLTCFLQVLSRGFAPIWKLTRKIRRSWHQADGWNSDTCDMTPLLFLTVTFRPLWTCQARAGTSLSAMRMEWESSWWGADVVNFTCGCTDVVFRLLSDGVDFFLGRAMKLARKSCLSRIRVMDNFDPKQLLMNACERNGLWRAVSILFVRIVVLRSAREIWERRRFVSNFCSCLFQEKALDFGDTPMPLLRDCVEIWWQAA